MNSSISRISQTMEATGIVPVFYHGDITVVKKVLKFCFEAGIRVFEFTNRGKNAAKVFKELNQYAKENFPEMIVGIGTILDTQSASQFMEYGSSFVVSPFFKPEILKTCDQRKILHIPGCSTLTEIGNAKAMGAKIIKIFPASTLGGPDFIKAIKSPLPSIRLMATGGVSLSGEELEKWFKAGVSCVGVGSSVFTPERIKNNNYEEIRTELEQALELIKKLKS